MSCRCGTKGCFLTPARSHFCPVCGEPHYTRVGAATCCDALTNDLDPETAQ